MVVTIHTSHDTRVPVPPHPRQYLILSGTLIFTNLWISYGFNLNFRFTLLFSDVSKYTVSSDISMITNKTQLFIYLWGRHVFSTTKYSSYLPIFLLGWLSFSSWIIGVLYMHGQEFAFLERKSSYCVSFLCISGFRLLIILLMIFHLYI